jgi:DNA polymerase IIIc chi subunit
MANTDMPDLDYEPYDPSEHDPNGDEPDPNEPIVLTIGDRIVIEGTVYVVKSERSGFPAYLEEFGEVFDMVEDGDADA